MLWNFCCAIGVGLRETLAGNVDRSRLTLTDHLERETYCIEFQNLWDTNFDTGIRHRTEANLLAFDMCAVGTPLAFDACTEDTSLAHDACVIKLSVEKFGIWILMPTWRWQFRLTPLAETIRARTSRLHPWHQCLPWVGNFKIWISAPTWRQWLRTDRCTPLAKATAHAIGEMTGNLNVRINVTSQAPVFLPHNGLST